MQIEEELAQINDVLDNYEKINGIPQCMPPGTERELAKYISMGIDELDSYTQEGCAEISYFLSQYSLYIQRLTNKETANLVWIDKKLIEYTCDKLKDYDQYMKHDYKIGSIARENTVVEQFIKLRCRTQQIIERLAFVASSIKHMSDMMKSLQMSKR